ncbi:ABC transporter permease [Pseudonocardia sp. CA-107938]|uniref:ABC transporter permease n=1 Tax=Pseudonocardia sp. CA-107938 TaxID=3240021 RepID=UPI003D9041AF
MITAARAPAAALVGTRKPRRRVDGWLWVALPGAVFLAVFFGYPLATVLLRSLTDPSPANYEVFAHSPAYLKILLQTFQISALVTIGCLVLGYPYAYLMAKAGGVWQSVLFAIVLLPIWTSFLVRSVAMQVWLQDTGVLNKVLMALGLTDGPVPLIRNTFGVTIGMTQILLPYLILPLYSVMRRVDPALVRAAASLGASPKRAFLRAYVPQTLPGVYSGGLLVFVLSLGFFIVPAILGGTEGSMIAKAIVDLVGKSQFGIASTLAVTLLAATFLILAIGSRFVRIRDVVGGGTP